MAEITIESLQAELDKQIQENLELSDKLTAAEKRAAELEDLSVGQKAELEILVGVNEELTLRIEELSSPKSVAEAVETAKAKEKATLPEETFEVEGKTYRFISPVFIHEKQRVTAAEALLDTDLQAKLVAKGSGAIQEVK